jgi:hypothetical protein
MLSRMADRRIRFDGNLPATDIPKGANDNRPDYHGFICTGRMRRFRFSDPGGGRRQYCCFRVSSGRSLGAPSPTPAGAGPVRGAEPAPVPGASNRHLNHQGPRLRRWPEHREAVIHGDLGLASSKEPLRGEDDAMGADAKPVSAIRVVMARERGGGAAGDSPAAAE